MTLDQLDTCPLHGSIAELETLIEQIDAATLHMPPTFMREALRCRRSRLWRSLQKTKHGLGFGYTGNAALPPGGGASEKFVQLAR